MADEKMMVCPKCGKAYAEGVKFCDVCGVSLEQREASPEAEGTSSEASPKAFCSQCGASSSQVGKDLQKLCSVWQKVCPLVLSMLLGVVFLLWYYVRFISFPSDYLEADACAELYEDEICAFYGCQNNLTVTRASLQRLGFCSYDARFTIRGKHRAIKVTGDVEVEYILFDSPRVKVFLPEEELLRIGDLILEENMRP